MKNNIEDIYQQSHAPIHEQDQLAVNELWEAIKELKRMVEVLEKEKADTVKVYR